MSKQELTRLDFIKKLIDRRLTQSAVSKNLGISIRQVQRLVRNYKDNNYTSLISKKRGRVSNNAISTKLKAKVLEIISSLYHDFGPTLAAEKLYNNHNYNFSVETMRKWMIESNLWVTRKQNLKRAYQPRYRRHCYGELVQIDGSLHPWFEDRAPKCTLLVYVDDATSGLMQLHFAPSESMQTYFAATKAYIKKHTRPLAFYSDKLSVFRITNKKAADNGNITQFGRALNELDIQLICANTCQAKGRVERANKTLQDRLVKELRLRDISNIDDANAYLEEFIIEYNSKFAKAPMGRENLHRDLLPSMNLDSILCYKTSRTVSHNLTFQHNRQLFLLKDTNNTRMLRRKQIDLCESPEGDINILYNGEKLEYKMVYDRVKTITQGEIITDNKYLSEVVNYSRKKLTKLPPKRRSTAAPTRTHLKHLV